MGPRLNPLASLTQYNLSIFSSETCSNIYPTNSILQNVTLSWSLNVFRMIEPFWRYLKGFPVKNRQNPDFLPLFWRILLNFTSRVTVVCIRLVCGVITGKSKKDFKNLTPLDCISDEFWPSKLRKMKLLWKNVTVETLVTPVVDILMFLEVFRHILTVSQRVFHSNS